jgi:uncharacterized membrane protein
MATDRRTVHIDASADAVWALVRDAGAVPAWFPSIKCCSVTGTKRTCVLQSGSKVVEEIVVMDDRMRRLQYRILSGIAVESHLGTIDVVEDAAAGCTVVYTTEVMPDGLAPALGGSVERALRCLRDAVSG